MSESKASAGGRGETQPLDAQRQAELIRALVERCAKGPPSARRRAIALANVRIARSIESSERGEA
jgi:hypothetical protein